MGTSNKYDDMSALDALDHAKEGTMLLPDIQREYCWDVSEIESLFESIVDDYPIGACIFWKTNRATINEEKPNLYRFINKYQKGKTKNEKSEETLSKESDYFIVLDGQQRITSLNIALKGSYACFKGGKGRSRSNPKSWIAKELYFNFDFYKKENVDDDEHPKKRFVFLNEEQAKAGNYYKVKSILGFDKIQYFIASEDLKWQDQKVIDDLSTLFQRLHDSGGNGLIHFYSISENTYDEALDIFVRVNSTGRKLSKSDLLFSTLIDGWKDGKNNIETILGSMNSKGDGFAFSRDYLMRLCLVLVGADTNLKIRSLNSKTIDQIRTNWKTIDSTCELLSSLLSEIGLYDENITSYNSTMPLAYFIYRGGSFNEEESKEEARKFIYISMNKNLFGVASNSALNNTRNVLKQIDCSKTPFSLSLFDSVVLVGNRNFKVEPADIDYWIDNYQKGRSTYVLLSLLYPKLKLNQVSFHQDHCHPYALFSNENLSSLGLSEEKIIEWQRKRNLLPNLQFLEGGENESKNKTPLADWANSGNDFCYHPQGVSLELKDFDTFFSERRKLIKNKLYNIFDVENAQNNS